MNTKAEENHAIQNARGWLEEIGVLVVKLNDDGLTDEQREQVRDEIQEGPLSVMVRDGWHVAGSSNAGEPEEYEILLSTGGPALRIWGNLTAHGEPDDYPHLQWQDWGTPWTDYPLEGDDREHLQTYASQFYFSE